LTSAKDKDGLRIGRSILQKELPAEEILKMLSEGKTNLLKGFVSNKTKRKFDAFLLLDPKTHKISFDFPPREPRVGAKAAVATGDGETSPAAKKPAKKAAKKAAKKKAK
jgi:DNA topoisomerase-3